MWGLPFQFQNSFCFKRLTLQNYACKCCPHPLNQIGPPLGWKWFFIERILITQKTYFLMLDKKKKIIKVFFWNLIFSLIYYRTDSVYKSQCPYVCFSVCLFVRPSHPRNHASWRIRDLWSMGVSQILAYLWTFEFLHLMIFSVFQKNRVFGYSRSTLLCTYWTCYKGEGLWLWLFL